MTMLLLLCRRKPKVLNRAFHPGDTSEPSALPVDNEVEDSLHASDEEDHVSPSPDTGSPAPSSQPFILGHKRHHSSLATSQSNSPASSTTTNNKRPRLSHGAAALHGL